MKFINFITLLLVIVGAINWGLIGFFQFDLISNLFGQSSTFTRIIFGIVGLCGLYCIKFLFSESSEK